MHYIDTLSVFSAVGGAAPGGVIGISPAKNGAMRAVRRAEDATCFTLVAMGGRLPGVGEPGERKAGIAHLSG